MNVIIDSNVLIASVAARGLCESILELCLEHHRIVLCEVILDEVTEKLEKKLKVPPKIIADFIKLLRDHSIILEPEIVDPNVCRDPNDLMILGLVNPSNANSIITGDKDLLVLEKYGTAQILTPRSFWKANQ
jgi:hypothetical protein